METVTSLVTSKFQVTVPKAVRENLKLAVNDTLNWEIENDKIIVRTNKNRFLSYRNAIKVGHKEIRDDINLARKLRMEKYR